MKIPNNGKLYVEMAPHKRCMPKSMPEREGNTRVPTTVVIGHSPMPKQAVFKTGKSG